MTKREKRQHKSHGNRPFGAPRTLTPLQHPSGFQQHRRASIAGPSTVPDRRLYQPSLETIIAQQKLSTSSKGRRLPTTPAEEPYFRSPHDPQRPHSRAESMPDPLPIPWKNNIAPFNQLVKTPTESSPPSKLYATVQEEKPSGFKEPTGALGYLRPSKKKSSLKPIRPKSSSLGDKGLSTSVDANLHLHTAGLSQPGYHTMSVMWPPQKNAQRRPSVGTEGPAPGNLAWQSANNIHRQTLPTTHGRDIQGLMVASSTPSSAYSSIRDIPQEIHQLQTGNESGSVVSVDTELFKPRAGVYSQPSRSLSPVTRSGDNLKVDPISGGDVNQKHHHHRSKMHHGYDQQTHHHQRSISAKTHQNPPPGYMGGQEISSSLGYVGVEQNYYRNNGEIPHQFEEQVCLAYINGL